MHIEKYSPNTAARQAWELSQLLDDAAIEQYLGNNRLAVYDRYQKTPLAHQAIERVAQRTDMDGYVLYVDEAAVGVGTVIKTMSVRRPESSFRLRGRQIDYWADPKHGELFHAEVARDLAQSDNFHGTVFATITQPEAAWAIGIPLTMAKTGEPGDLMEENTHFGLETVAEPLQAYFRHIGAPVVANSIQ